MPLVNQEAERIVRGMKKSRHRFKELYGKRDKEVMYATANKLAQKKQTKQRTWKSGQGFAEANKSGDNSLRDWFSKSKSSDGKLVGFNSVVNMQENPALNNQDKQLNPSAVQVK